MRTWMNDTRGRATILAMALGTVFLLALVVGFLAGVPQGDVPPAYAACKTAWPACIGGDNTRTSTLWVDHRTGEEYLIPIEPETGEDWSIAVHYSPPPIFPCVDTVYTVTASVDFVDGTGWTVSCSGCNPTAGPVKSIGICSDDGCNIYNEWSYVLKLDLLTVDPTTGKNLSQVVYTTTSVDDGVSIDYPDTCNEDTAVSPTSQTWSQSDTTFPCSLDCNYDATLVILYE